MERFAGNLILAVKSRRNPNAVLALRVKRVAQLNHIKNKFNLHERLDFDRVREDPNEVTQREKMYPNQCELLMTLNRLPSGSCMLTLKMYMCILMQESFVRSFDCPSFPEETWLPAGLDASPQNRCLLQTSP